MTSTEFLLLGLVVIAAVAAGYFIGRWASEREQGARAARPNPLPSPGEDDAEVNVPPPRHRGAPPPVSAGGDTASAEAVPAPRQRRGPPPPAAAGEDAGAAPAAGSEQTSAKEPRARRGPPPPAAAGLADTGDTPKRGH